MNEEQPLTEEQQSLKEAIDRQVQAVVVPMTDQAFDTGGISALRSAAYGFMQAPQETFTRDEVVYALAQMERAMDPEGKVGAIVSQLEQALSDAP